MRDFILGNDTRVDAAIVTSDRIRSQLVALPIASAVEFAGASAFSFTLPSHWIFLPAVEKISYSLGIQLAKEDDRSSAGLFKPGIGLFNPGVASTRCMRYFRDIEGRFTSVGHFEDGTELMYLSSCSSRLRSHSFASTPTLSRPSWLQQSRRKPTRTSTPCSSV